MNNKINFLKVSLIALFGVMTSFTAQAQQGFCDPLDQNTITGVTGPGCTGTAVDNVLGNWGTINASVGYSDTGSINGAGDIFLDILDGGCSNGGSFVYNNVDYNGNYLAMTVDDGCFCFDIKTFHIQTGNLTPNTLRLYDGPNPLASTLSATFVMNGDYDVSRGWVRICAPITPSDGINVPSNADGQWVMNTGGAAAWDTLITSIGSIGYYVDVAGGSERFGLDNICISEVCDSTYNDDEPTEEGSFCCDSENLVNNGNFEFGNTGFSSDYVQNGATFPGEYDVTTSAANFGATITDHSFCDDASLYATNDMYLLVNGKTQQPAGSKSNVWKKSLNLKNKVEYRFCANFKNMPQCTFDILPQIEITTNTGVIETATINVDPLDPCAWQNVSFCFIGEEDMDITISLLEDGNGDGNDLAIDDISVQALQDPNYFLTIQHQGDSNDITGSLNTLGTGDDILLNENCEQEENYFWFVYETANPTGPLLGAITPNTFAWSSNINSSCQPAACPIVGPWGLTTNFPDYPFASDTFYVIGMYIPSCCETCYTDSWEYQISYNSSGLLANGGLSRKQKEIIKEHFIDFSKMSVTLGVDQKRGEELSIYPNPATSIVNLSLASSEITSIIIHTLDGRRVKEIAVDTTSSTQQFTTDSLTTGLYMIFVRDSNNKSYTSKLVIK